MTPSGRALLDDFRSFAGGRLTRLLLLMVAGALAEGFGILLLLPILAVIDGTGRWAATWPTLAAMPRDGLILAGATAFAALMIARAILLYARDRCQADLTTRYDDSLRIRAAETLAARGWRFSAGIGQARMQSLLATDIPRASLAVFHALAVVVGLSVLAVQFTLAFLLSPRLALFVFLLIGGGLALAWRWLGAARRTGEAMTVAAADAASAASQLQAGLKQAIAEGEVATYLDEIAGSLGRMADTSLAFTTDQAKTRALTGALAALSAAAVLLLGTLLLHLPAPVLVAALVVFARMSGPAQQVQQSAHNFAVNAPGFAAVQALLGPFRHPVIAATRPAARGFEQLSADGIGYRHDASRGLFSANLTIQPGEWIGIAGPSGGGKTTLIDLIAGLIEPQQGALTLDGAPLVDQPARWRAMLAYVGQDPVLFRDTLRNNLRWDAVRADDAALMRAISAVGLDSLVAALPDGIDQILGDQGAPLSGGERQRLVLARALLRRPALYLLDEATSALDPGSERDVLAALRATGAAAIIVSHRQETLTHCDRQLSIVGGVLQ